MKRLDRERAMGEQPIEITVRVHDDPDGMWAEVLEHPGIFGAGDTLEEVRQSVLDGLEAVLGHPVVAQRWDPVEPPSVTEHRVLVTA